MKTLILTLLLAVAYAKHEQYQGWKSLYVKPSSQAQLKDLHRIAEVFEVDVLSHPTVEREGVVLVRPEHQAGFTKMLEEQDILYRVHAADLKVALDYDDMLIEAKKNSTKARNGRQLPYDNYQEIEVIYAYLDDIAARYPDRVTLVTPADSFEGRPIKYLKISTTNFEDQSKPVIFIDGGIHAREWISPPTVTWAINKLVEDVTEPDLLERFDWVLLPVVNPDGYKFTFTDNLVILVQTFNMKVCVLAFFFAVVYAKHEQYQGWKSFYVKPSGQPQLKVLGLITDAFEVDVLSHPTVEREGVMLVSHQHQAGFTKMLEDQDILYRVHAADVKVALDYDDVLIEAKKNSTKAKNGRQLPYDNYQELEVIDAYLDDIAARYPDRVTLVTPANSFEGRPIKYLKISTTNFEDQSKPVIFIDGGIHSREWISPPTVTWAINKLVEDVTEPDLLERFDWILLPVVNPDGYKFTFTNSRFWRKTRSTDTNSLSYLCPGVDGNRNYDFVWNTVGTSNNPCTDTYAGNRAFSEIETRVVRDIIDEHLHRMALYLTMHSYGSMMLYPWGHDGSLSNNALALHTVGVAMADAIHSKALSYFPRYIVGNSLLVIGYGVAGAAEDYAHYIGVPLAYTYELPGLAGGFDGFHLNPRYIEQVCLETWEGIVVGARRAGDLFVPPP